MVYNHHDTDTDGIKDVLQPADIQMLKEIHMIIRRGHDAEIRKKRDGTFAVYEIKRNKISVK